MSCKSHFFRHKYPRVRVPPTIPVQGTWPSNKEPPSAPHRCCPRWGLAQPLSHGQGSLVPWPTLDQHQSQDSPVTPVRLLPLFDEWAKRRKSSSCSRGGAQGQDPTAHLGKEQDLPFCHQSAARDSMTILSGKHISAHFSPLPQENEHFTQAKGSGCPVCQPEAGPDPGGCVSA